jgi:hypothetical protein
MTGGISLADLFLTGHLVRFFAFHAIAFSGSAFIRDRHAARG